MTDTTTLVLDLDGTLVDTAPDLVATLNWVLTRAGHAPLPYDIARDAIGHGARGMLETAHRIGERAVAPETVTAQFETFIAHYETRMSETSRPFAGAEEALERFQVAGWQLAICTNKHERLARQLMEDLDLAARFSAICGGDTFAFRKPDARHLAETVRRAGGDPARAVMVGDSITDIDAARNAHIPVVAVSFGYSADPVASLGPDRVIDHFDRLWRAANELLPPAAA